MTQKTIKQIRESIHALEVDHDKAKTDYITAIFHNGVVYKAKDRSDWHVDILARLDKKILSSIEQLDDPSKVFGYWDTKRHKFIRTRSDSNTILGSRKKSMKDVERSIKKWDKIPKRIDKDIF